MQLRQCEHCGRDFQAKEFEVAKGWGRFCSRSCARLHDWSKREEGHHYKWLRIPGHPLANAAGTVHEHRVVLYETIGPGTHPCHWCGQPITWRNYQDGSRTGSGALLVDHLDRNKRNNDPANLVPTCHKCNTWRNPPKRNTVRDDEDFRIQSNGSRTRAFKISCEVCGQEVMGRRGQRFCDRACAGKSHRKDYEPAVPAPA